MTIELFFLHCNWQINHWLLFQFLLLCFVCQNFTTRTNTLSESTAQSAVQLFIEITRNANQNIVSSFFSWFRTKALLCEKNDVMSGGEFLPERPKAFHFGFGSCNVAFRVLWVPVNSSQLFSDDELTMYWWQLACLDRMHIVMDDSRIRNRKSTFFLEI